MIEISQKRYGELINSAIRAYELEQELARMTKNFEMQTENVKYWKSAADDARASVRCQENELREKDAEILDLKRANDAATKKLSSIVILALFGAK